MRSLGGRKRSLAGARHPWHYHLTQGEAKTSSWSKAWAPLLDPHMERNLRTEWAAQCPPHTANLAKGWGWSCKSHQGCSQKSSGGVTWPQLIYPTADFCTDLTKETWPISSIIGFPQNVSISLGLTQIQHLWIVSSQHWLTTSHILLLAPYVSS